MQNIKLHVAIIFTIQPAIAWESLIKVFNCRRYLCQPTIIIFKPIGMMSIVNQR